MSWISGLSFTLLIALTFHQPETCDAARILAIYPLQGKSHYMMCESIARALAARGHQIDVISHFPLKNPPPNYRDISIAGTLPIVVNNLTLAQAEVITSGSLNNLLQFAGMNVCELLDLPQFQNIIKNPPTDPPYDILIYEVFAADCYLAFGRHLNIPIVGLVTGRMIDWMHGPMGNPQSTAFNPSIFSGFSQQMNFFERLRNTIMTNMIRIEHWYYISSQIPLVEKHFGVKISSMSELYKDIAVLLMNTHPSFDSIQPTTAGIIEVGGLHVTDSHQELSPEVKKWLDDSKDGCVYFSFGSMIKVESFPPKTVKAFYEAFDRIAPVRVLMKVAKKDELLPGLPKNVMTNPWLPQIKVLKHKNVKVFVSHGGLMSTQEAITCGVPMVHVPLFADQHINALGCRNKNISVVIDHRTVTADEFTEALKTVLENPLYSGSAKRISKLFTDRPMSAIDTAVYWVEYVIRNGNVLRSPAADLSWWQIELFDVYGFIILVVLLSLYIIKRLIGIVMCSICPKSTKQTGAESTSKSKKNK